MTTNEALAWADQSRDRSTEPYPADGPALTALAAEVRELRRKVAAAEGMAEAMEGVFPDGECSCHVDPPCSYCVSGATMWKLALTTWQEAAK